MQKTDIAVDVKGLDPLNLKVAIRAAEAQGADELHFDVADGQFIPRFGFAPEVITAVKQLTALPCHAHLLLRRPEPLLPQILACGADIVTLHVETCIHLHRALSVIRDAGKRAGVAVNPTTSLTKLNYVLPLVDRLLLLGTDPASPATALPRGVFERIRILHENIRYHEYTARIEVEGPMGTEDAARCIRFGAVALVARPDDVAGLGDAENRDALAKYRQEIAATAHTV